MDSVNTAAALLKRILEKRIMLPVDPDNPPKDFKEGRFLIFIGGGNGGGKSTLANFITDELENEGYKKGYVANFGSNNFRDILSNRALRPIHKPMLGYIEAATKSDKANNKDGNLLEPGFFKKVALKTFQSVRQKAMTIGAPIVIDNHMDNPDFVADCIDEARAHGYQCIMISPHIDAEKIIPRLEARHKKTGKEFIVPKAILRHKRFAENLEGYLDNFDLSVILDNSKENLPPSIIAISHRGGDIKIFDKEAYERVQRKRNLNVSATGVDDIWQQQPAESSVQTDTPKPETMEKSYRKDFQGREREPGKGHFIGMIERDLIKHFTR